MLIVLLPPVIDTCEQGLLFPLVTLLRGAVYGMPITADKPNLARAVCYTFHLCKLIHRVAKRTEASHAKQNGRGDREYPLRQG